MNRETCQQVPNTVIKTLDTKKRETPDGIETQRIRNRNTTHPNTTEQALSQEHKTIVKIIKRTISEKKTELISLRIQGWKTVKVKTERNKQIINKYLNEKNDRIKQTDLYRSNISLC